jgi:predicted nucleic acid-binding protein
LVLATALESGCSLVVSEDMKHNQIIEAGMRIVNPLIDG